MSLVVSSLEVLSSNHEIGLDISIFSGAFQKFSFGLKNTGKRMFSTSNCPK
ncbi:hypothetical protein LEP1GSC058_1588 [Leptospira fainei serovar Hurstbridge str. BUT 6]|uniref:Uncharacterized protein n=1 Tax=Leptospira fainei serovar Hurstbridge str. BUT 6 TaxID=1193011 RepID=S3V0K5_9LEPT|nr:hypothetical protein LEP1GSC058_1588 [Leptospira fainei serovar Hurstbridge str. BUT 6]